MATKYKGVTTRKIGTTGFTFQIEYDLTKLRELRKRLNKLKNTHIKYGWLTNKRHKDSGLPLATLAHFQEFGTNKGRGFGFIPPRPYFQQMNRLLKGDIDQQTSVIFDATLTGDSTEAPLKALGDTLVSKYKESVNKQNMVALSSFTISRKGHDIQLHRTGELVKSFGYKVYKSSMTKEENKQKTMSNK